MKMYDAIYGNMYRETLWELNMEYMLIHRHRQEHNSLQHYSGVFVHVMYSITEVSSRERTPSELVM